jgi:hypothetical protein
MVDGHPNRDCTPGQFSEVAQGMPVDDASAACGPVAAIAFARYANRSLTIAEVITYAEGIPGPQDDLWSNQVGMYGPAKEQELLARLGIACTLDWSPTEDEIQARVARAEPVIVSSPTHYHYFVLTDHDPRTGKYYVGTTGTVWRDASRNADWRTFADMAPQAALYLARGS